MATPNDTFEARRKGTPDEPTAPAAPPKLKLVSISHNHAGVLHGLTDEGRVFKYDRDPHAINVPGVHMKWQEIVGP